MQNPFSQNFINDVAVFATSAGTSVVLGSGQVSCATNGEKKWGGVVPWSSQPNAVVTAYAAGAYRKVRVSFASAALTVNKQQTIRIREDVPALSPSTTPGNPINLVVDFFSSSSAPTAINWATWFYAAINQYAALNPERYTIAYTPGNNYVDVTCKFGVTDIYNYPWTITCPTDAAVTFTDQTALAQPVGTVAMVNYFTGGAGTVGVTYDMYAIYYDEKVSVPNGNGVNGVQRYEKIIFVDTTGGITGSGAFNTTFQGIFAGTATASKYLSRPIA